MKKRLIATMAALSLLLSGCASLLDREYSNVTLHNTAPTAEGDPSILRAESYQELVNALIYFINLGVESGSIRMYIDSDDVGSQLENACLEVVQEDALGAYAVDFIKYSVDPVVTYHQAEVQITYRRTKEQVASIVSATGATAIRSELETALAGFAPERVLRISYFADNQDYILQLVREAYYSNPATALGMPEADISIYPETGRQRIVEILLTYPLPFEELERRKQALEQECQKLQQQLWPLSGDHFVSGAAQAILERGGYDPSGGSTAYHALVEGGGDSEGLALAMSMVCAAFEVPCHLVSGTLDDQPHFWNVVQTQSGWRHIDLTTVAEQDNPLHVDSDMEQQGYQWNTETVPACEAPEILAKKG